MSEVFLGQGENSNKIVKIFHLNYFRAQISLTKPNICIKRWNASIISKFLFEKFLYPSAAGPQTFLFSLFFVLNAKTQKWKQNPVTSWWCDHIYMSTAEKFNQKISHWELSHVVWSKKSFLKKLKKFKKKTEKKQKKQVYKTE